MRWIQPTRPRLQPPHGTYPDWKPQIAVTCSNQCVYCAISEGAYGGLDNFHVEHYRPKSKFDLLTDIITNLYLACAICNRFKSDDWPNEPAVDHSLAAYPDPIEFDYNLLFSIDQVTHVISGLHVATRYMVERLYLNRPQLMRERRLRNYVAILDRLYDEITELAHIVMAGNQPPNVQLKLLALLTLSADSFRDASRARDAVPYQLHEVRRVDEV